MIFSATYALESTASIVKYMRDPAVLRLSADEPSLAGVKNYVAYVERGDARPCPRVAAHEAAHPNLEPFGLVMAHKAQWPTIARRSLPGSRTPFAPSCAGGETVGHS
jgi:hypothetical protein